MPVMDLIMALVYCTCVQVVSACYGPHHGVGVLYVCTGCLCLLWTSLAGVLPVQFVFYTNVPLPEQCRNIVLSLGSCLPCSVSIICYKTLLALVSCVIEVWLGDVCSHLFSSSMPAV